MGAIRMRPAICAASLLIVAGSLGCSSFAPRPSALPTSHTLVLEPLVIYSDFALPPHHRLLEELVLERNDLLSKLQLPKSEEPVSVYLFDTEERFREFLHRQHPDFPQRRAFFVETDTRLVVYAQWGDRVAEDLRHEVAHGYLHSIVPTLPLWLDEGLAEYAEVPRGSGGLNQPHLRLLLERLANFGWKPDLARLERINSASDMTQIDYAEAWAWTYWLMEGDHARRGIVQGYLDQLRKGEVVPPFSVLLRNWFPQPEPVLVAYLRSIGSTTR